MKIGLRKGDCLEVMDRMIASGFQVDAIVTDPPYKITTGGDSGGKNSKRPKGILSGDRKLMNTVPKFDDWLSKCFSVVKDGSQNYFMSNSTNLLDMMNAVVRAGFKIQNILVWEKNNCTPSQFYMKNCEYTIFARKGKSKYINDIGGSKTVHHYDNIIGNKVHPTEKPQELMEFYIGNSTNEGDTVFDPFMGSGTTGVACKKLNRSFVGIEIDDKYFEIAKERIESAE